MTITVRTDRPKGRLLGSPAVMRWFDMAGVTDIPPTFVGSLREKIRFGAGRETVPPAMVVAAIAPVSAAYGFVSQVRASATTFINAGIERTHVYESVDQPNELMVFHEFDDSGRAHAIADLPRIGLAWAERAGLAIYPPVLSAIWRIPSTSPRRDGRTDVRLPVQRRHRGPRPGDDPGRSMHHPCCGRRLRRGCAMRPVPAHGAHLADRCPRPPHRTPEMIWR